ncbi:MAG: saccharopine dehydrogenase C-terminal domain-containing protein [Acidobacteriota bacterium]
MRVLVLGAGRVGAAMAVDLAAHNDLDVTVCDRSEAALSDLPGSIERRVSDLKDPRSVAGLLAEQDLAVGAVPGPMGFATARAVIESATPLVDISFFEEDAFELDSLARERGVPALVDCGVAPGASNLILGRLEAELDAVSSFTCYVGGLPISRRAPFEYRAPFSPIDVLAEYTRPARLREAGREVVRPALGRPELLDFPEIGTLEAFETDGLRTLLKTSRTPTLIEKTLRYPGHRRLMEIFRDAGFLGDEPVDLADGTRVRPLDLTARLLFEQWRPEPGERELTVMRVLVEGEAGGRGVRHVYDLLDRTHPETGVSSMARTTGYTATAMVRLLADGLYGQPGIAPAELVGRDAGCFEAVMAYLEQRGVRFRHAVEDLGAR